MDRSDFDEFARQSMPALGRYAYILTGNRHAAEELLQDTLVRVATAWRRIRSDGNPLGYARTTMMRLHLSWLRRWRATSALADDAEGAPDPRLGQVDERDAVHRALARLTALQRAVLVLSYLDDLDDATIADMLDRRPATIRSLRHRALHATRDLMAASTPV